MRLADFVAKRRPSFADIATTAVAYVCGEAFGWAGAFLILLAGSISIYAGLAVLLCLALFVTLIVRRELKRDIRALDDPNDNPRANRLIGDTSSASIRTHRSALRPAVPRPDRRMTRALDALEDMAVRFAIELFKSVAIIMALTLGMGFAAEVVAFVLSDRDVSGAFGSGLAGVAGGVLGLVLAVVIVLRRIADIED
ncbi:nitrate reductase gamma subunit [Bradyrhizobium sp. USDA 4524]|uniref:hypothetical protein n=1 Tax=unclassified Bradyrhizobium TaxID=2631580 RepID=UPI00209CBA97|nr:MULTISPECIES: hypothetical protein [unclassified Bradyrhizobium]MCP1844837.1 nitrate reductase gamma subunit [Bradyrhizobium sp. USDA 4538]MCP1905402.1 nitrate reductase gamma subunit [Bradyrhizobium sp. USDA 4537]MCP1988942.1 nitrate reductase gamma subunit [Bradyrhizobium sp. USDA 4539]